MDVVILLIIHIVWSLSRKFLWDGGGKKNKIENNPQIITTMTVDYYVF